MTMPGASVRLLHSAGLHARPVVTLTKLAKTFASRILIAAHVDGPWIDAKSVVKVMGMKTQSDPQLYFRADGVDADAAWKSLGGRPAVAEQALDLELELSVMVARRASGEVVVYPPAVNHHERQILAWSVLPGELDPAIAAQARDLARAIAESFSLEGILAVEMFLTRDGRLLVNELAPRPHNSYHASELACPTSQFEQLVRAVCDLPLGVAEPTRPAAIVNLFGDLWQNDRAPDFASALSVAGTRLFLYGKRGPRPGRKMGHLAAIGDSPADALARVQRAASRL